MFLSFGVGEGERNTLEGEASAQNQE
jgi:hypothetical protein